MNSQAYCTVAVFLLATAVLGVYWPGLNGPFVLDDFHNFVENPWMALSTLDFASLRDALFSFGAQYPHRGLARLTFALNHYFAGAQFQVFAFKLTNVVIHIVSATCVFMLARMLLLRCLPEVKRDTDLPSSVLLAFCIAAVWALHPIQLTSVLYVVQRMTSMSGLFVFAGLCCFVLGRVRLERSQRFAWALIAGGTAASLVLGFLCKQNAVLLPLYALLIEYFFFKRDQLSPAAVKRLRLFFAMCVVLPGIAVLLGVGFSWERIEEMYLLRDYTPFERLLTQSRILFFYLLLMVFPRPDLFGLYHDDIVVSTGLLDPVTTLFAVIAWCVLVVLAIWGARQRALWSFAIFWYLSGHVLESTVVGLELAYEHRNYVPTFGLAFVAVVYLTRYVRERAGEVTRLVRVVGVLLIAVMSFATLARANVWGSLETLSTVQARNHPDSPRAFVMTARLQLLNREDIKQVFGSLQKAALVDDSTVVPLVEMSKIAHNMLAALQQGKLPEDPPLERNEFGIDTPLVFNRSHLQGQLKAYAASISERIESFAVSVETAQSLVHLTRCELRGEPPCVALSGHLDEWFDIALRNEKLHPDQEAALKLFYAKHLAATDRSERATALMQQAVDLFPNKIYFRLEQFELYTTRGEWQDAERVLAELETERHWAGFQSDEISLARERLSSAKTPAQPQS